MEGAAKRRRRAASLLYVYARDLAGAAACARLARGNARFSERDRDTALQLALTQHFCLCSLSLLCAYAAGPVQLAVAASGQRRELPGTIFRHPSPRAD